jgi:Holliday junction resolvase RusA-like endonuclease
MTMSETYTGPIWVPGHPVPKGSMKCIAKHAPGHSARLVPDKRNDPDTWAGRVPQALAHQLPELVARPLDGPVTLVADFYLAKPKSTRFPQAPIGHGSGDADKFTRMIGDAMQNAGVVTDDSRICEIHARKLYADPTVGEGARLELRPALTVEAAGGRMPVRLQAGRVNALIGHIDDPADMPKLLRAVADQMERAS